MATLLIRCAGPMQSWGTQSRFRVRDTGREPSKSGIIGLLCAALGRPRSAPLDDLVALKMGVRIDHEGRIERDYQTAGKGGYYRIGGGVERTDLIVSTRYYLADARFLVGLEGNISLLRELEIALENPVWPLCLGRKSFVPGEPVWLSNGLHESDLETALQRYAWPEAAQRLRAVIEDPQGSVVVNDTPISFVRRSRSFRPRRVAVKYLYPQTTTEEV